MTTLALDRPRIATAAIDALLCVVVVAVPALSHVAAYPLYYFDPMRLLLFAAVLFTSRRNALLMAVWLPLLSMSTSGHPAFPKFLLIQGELVLNAAMFYSLYGRTNRFVLGAAVSVLASKAAYYAAKFFLIELALMDGDLIATSWPYQFATLLFILAGGGLVCTARGKVRT